jgi:hypothetical protein
MDNLTILKVNYKMKKIKKLKVEESKCLRVGEELK